MEQRFRDQIDITFQPFELPKPEMLEALTENRKRFQDMCEYPLNNNLIDYNNSHVTRYFDMFLTKMEEAKDALGKAIFYSK